MSPSPATEPDPTGEGAAPLDPASALDGFFAVLETPERRWTGDDRTRLRRALGTQGPWTLRKLRHVLGALWAGDPEGMARFDEVFDAFFDVERVPEGSGDGIDLQRVLAELASAPVPAPASVSAPAPSPPEPEASPPVAELPSPWATPRRPSLLRRGVWVLLLSVVVVAVAVILALRTPDPEEPLTASTEIPAPPPPSTKEGVEPGDRTAQGTTTAEVSGVRIYPQGFRIVEAEPPSTWSDNPWAWGFWPLLAIALGYPILVTWRRTGREPKIPLDLEARGDFDVTVVGGGQPPRLGDTVLDRLAESLGYFQSEETSEILDVDGTIAATTGAAGRPVLVFSRRRFLRTVLVVRDAHAEALAWNPAVDELVAGLQERGVRVLDTTFTGAPERFRDADGALYRLEALDAERQRYLVLVVTDGQGLAAADEAAVETLAHWPMVAWIDPREERSWDRSLWLPARLGIPIFPATAEGLARAFGQFLAEVPDPKERGASAPPRPHRPSPELRGRVEEILGDALAWGQACAMVQPLPLGLADAVRRRFHPQLPAHRIERLHRLPGTRRGAAGLTFEAGTLAILRRGFRVLRDDDAQDEVLRFLLGEIDAAEPEAEGSLAHLTWLALRERVHLELDPAAALPKLGALVRTPVGESVRAQLAELDLGDGRPGGEVPLRRLPEKPRDLERLERLATGGQVSKSWSRVEMLVGGGLTWVAMAVGAVAMVTAYLGDSYGGRTVSVENQSGRSAVVLDLPTLWVRYSVAHGATEIWSQPPDAGGLWVLVDRQIEEHPWTTAGERGAVTLVSGRATQPCSEEVQGFKHLFPSGSPRILRCPPGETEFESPVVASTMLFRLGLIWAHWEGQKGETGLDAAGAALAEGSVDAVLEIPSSGDEGPAAADEIIAQLWPRGPGLMTTWLTPAGRREESRFGGPTSAGAGDGDPNGTFVDGEVQGAPTDAAAGVGGEPPGLTTRPVDQQILDDVRRADAEALDPRIYLHATDDFDFKRAFSLIPALEDLGYTVPRSPTRAEEGPSETQLRFFRREDESEARKILDQLRELGLDVRLTPMWEQYQDAAGFRPRHYELWLAPPTASAF